MEEQHLKELSEKLNLTRIEFGNLFDVHYRTIQQLESREYIPDSMKLLQRPYFEKAGMAYLLDDYEGGDTPAKTAVITEVGAIAERNLSDKFFVLLAEAHQVYTNLLEYNAKLMKIMEGSADKK